MMYAQDTSSIGSPVVDDQYEMQYTTSVLLDTIHFRSDLLGESQRSLRNIDQSVASVDGLVSPLFDPIRKQISEFAKLRRNWNSYGAEPIEEESIRAALKLLSCLPSGLAAEIGENMVPTAAVPVPDGGVQLEWMLTNLEVEVEFEADGSISCLLEWKEGDPRFEEFDDLTNEEVVGVITKQFRAR